MALISLTTLKLKCLFFLILHYMASGDFQRSKMFTAGKMFNLVTNLPYLDVSETKGKFGSGRCN